MRVLMINSVCGIRSTGRICTDLAQQMEQQGHEVKIAYGRVETVPDQLKKYAVRIGNAGDLRMHALRTRILDEHGFGSKKATRAFLRWADAYDPQVLWLHNIHGYYINVEMLFEWIKARPEMRVKWTLHDCWPFTGHCTHFMLAGCEQWKTGCQHCSQHHRYPASWMRDNSRQNYARKKAAFTGVKNMTLITPSQWLADLTRESFLHEYPVQVQYNTIDTTVFKPTPGDFRERYGLESKMIILGVASTWDETKGLEDFFRLAETLPPQVQIVLVGLNEAQQKRCLGNVTGILRTNNVQELAEIYTAADIFFNPTYEDNYPTVNLEAEACGTPVITYASGGSAETLHRADSCAVQPGDWNCVRIWAEKKGGTAYC